MKYSQSKNFIISIVLTIVTFLITTVYPAVKAYGEDIEASIQTDASTPFKETDDVLDVPLTVTEVPEMTTMANDPLEVTPMANDTPEVTPIADATPEVTPMVSDTPEVTPTASVPPEVATMASDTPEVTPIADDTPEVTPLGLEFPKISPAIIDTFKTDDDFLSNTTTVYNYDGLLSALSTDNGYEIIYLGAAIVADERGLTIHPSKSEVIIDGCQPDALNDKFYNFTQFSSTSPDTTIHLATDNTTTKNITLQNIAIQGDNSNGIVFISDDISDVTVRYQNVRYVGPQAVSNHQGSVQFIDCSFTMSEDPYDDSQYVAEANYIQLAGNVEIKTSSFGSQILTAVFLPTNENPHLDVLENASVETVVYGYFLDIHLQSVDITIQDHAYFNIIGSSGFTTMGENIRNIVIEPYATVKLTQNDSQTYGTLRVEETLKMEQGSNLLILRMGLEGSAIIFPYAGGKAIFDNPERVILFSPGKETISFVEQGDIEITTSVINIYEEGTSPILSNPDYIWNNSNNKLITLSGTYVNDVPTNFSHNLDVNAPITDTLTTSIFNLSSMAALVFGRLDLSVDHVYITDDTIMGVTESSQNQYKIYVNATYEGLLTPLDEQLADVDGCFSFSVDPETLSSQNAITITSYFNSLTKREIIFPREKRTGELTFSGVPSNITFNTTTIPATPTTISRANGNFAFSVSDTRNYPAPWRVDAYITEPLSATLASNRKISLPDALVFVDEAGKSTPLSTTPLPVYYENSFAAGEFDVSWNEHNGILLNLLPGDIYSNVSYNTTIHWSLVDAP